MDLKWKGRILEAIRYLNHYIPLQETYIKSEANICIYLYSWGKVKSVFPSYHENKNSYGVGGMLCKVGKNYVNCEEGAVLLKKRLFTYEYCQREILHELLHSLGIAGHSDNPLDVMHKGGSVVSKRGDIITFKKSGISVNINDFKNLTKRDLNTLWLLYNQW